MTNFDGVDYFEALDLVEDPYPYFEFLRQQGPAVYLPKHNVVAIVGDDEGVEVLKDQLFRLLIQQQDQFLPCLLTLKKKI